MHAEKGTAASADDSVPNTSTSDLPSDASQVVERLASCFHFSGEINGDGSIRDNEVFAAMTELRCDTIEQEVLAMRKKYAGNTAVEDALSKATEL